MENKITKKKTRLFAVLVAPLAVLAALVFGTSSAMAQTAALTYTVTAGSATTADNPVSFKAHAEPVNFSDLDAGIPMTCDSSDATAGTVDVGTGLGPDKLGTIDNISWANCQGLGVQLTVTPCDLPWYVNADGATPTDANGDTYGNITGSGPNGELCAQVKDTTSAGGVCSFDVVGTASAYYDNPSHSLIVNEDGTAPDQLTIKNPSGTLCGGLLADGDIATYNATYVVTAVNPAFDPIQINSD